jgi:hypothetical protein
VDMLLGRISPELGGRSDLIDLIGLNFYPDNQWYHRGPPIGFGHQAYRPLSDMLTEVAERYESPLFIAETGAEGSARAAWLHYVCDEVAEAESRGVRLEGICLYPILDYPGWENERICEVGLLGAVEPNGLRRVCTKTAAELSRQRRIRALTPSVRHVG